MRRIAAALVPAVVGLAASGLAPPAWGDDGPELTPPTVAGPVGEPPGELPMAIEATPIPGPGAILVVPGITGPRSRPPVRANGPNPVTLAPRVEIGLPALVGPSEMGEAPPVVSRAPARPVGPTGLDGRPPLTLDSVPAVDPADVAPTPDAGGRPTTSGPRPAPPASRRPGGLFGRFFPPAPIDRRRAADEDTVKVEPRTDPAADAALKRKVERQVRDTLGGRLKSYEVRVVGREVSVVARASRFWQKRSVRSALESLPALNGYKSRVEIID